MNHSDKWVTLERNLRSLLQHVEQNIDKENADLVLEFIDNREFGVALEWLYILIQNRHIVVATEQMSEIGRLSAEMEIDVASMK